MAVYGQTSSQAQTLRAIRAREVRTVLVASPPEASKYAARELGFRPIKNAAYNGYRNKQGNATQTNENLGYSGVPTLKVRGW